MVEPGDWISINFKMCYETKHTYDADLLEMSLQVSHELSLIESLTN